MSVLEVVSFEDSWGEWDVCKKLDMHSLPFHLCTLQPSLHATQSAALCMSRALEHIIPCRDLSKRTTMVQVLDSSLKDTAALIFLTFQRKFWYLSNEWICYLKKISDSDPTAIYLAHTRSLEGFKLKRLLRLCMFPTQLFPLNWDLGDCSDPNDCC